MLYILPFPYSDEYDKVRVEKETSTKWVNRHLKKVGTSQEQAYYVMHVHFNLTFKPSLLIFSGFVYLHAVCTYLVSSKKRSNKMHMHMHRLNMQWWFEC